MDVCYAPAAMTIEARIILWIFEMLHFVWNHRLESLVICAIIATFDVHRIANAMQEVVNILAQVQVLHERVRMLEVELARQRM